MFWSRMICKSVFRVTEQCCGQGNEQPPVIVLCRTERPVQEHVSPTPSSTFLSTGSFVVFSLGADVEMYRRL